MSSSSLHFFCACGGELIAENLTPEAYIFFINKWTEDHDRPQCHPTGRFRAQWRRWMDFFAEL